MRFTRFGVTLKRLERKDIETIRRWRNSSWVRPNMRWQEHIGAEDQARWFESLDSRCDWYFIAESGRQQFGLFHVKKIDWHTSCGEAGGFVGARELIGGPEAAMATLALMDFAFLLLRLQSLQAQYHTRLCRVSRFNARLGYRILHEDTDGFVRASVTAERYLCCADSYRKAAVRSRGAVAKLVAPDPWLHARIVGSKQTGPQQSNIEIMLT